MHKFVYLNCKLLFSQLYQKRPYLKFVYSSSAGFELVQYLNVIEDLSSSTQDECLWIQILILYLIINVTFEQL